MIQTQCNCKQRGKNNSTFYTFKCIAAIKRDENRFKLKFYFKKPGQWFSTILTSLLSEKLLHIGISGKVACSISINRSNHANKASVFHVCIQDWVISLSLLLSSRLVKVIFRQTSDILLPMILFHLLYSLGFGVFEPKIMPKSRKFRILSIIVVNGGWCVKQFDEQNMLIFVVRKSMCVCECRSMWNTHHAHAHSYYNSHGWPLLLMMLELNLRNRERRRKKAREMHTHAHALHASLRLTSVLWDNDSTFAFIIKKHDLLPRAHIYTALNVRFPMWRLWQMNKWTLNCVVAIIHTYMPDHFSFSNSVYTQNGLNELNSSWNGHDCQIQCEQEQQQQQRKKRRRRISTMFKRRWTWKIACTSHVRFLGCLEVLSHFIPFFSSLGYQKNRNQFYINIYRKKAWHPNSFRFLNIPDINLVLFLSFLYSLYSLFCFYLLWRPQEHSCITRKLKIAHTFYIICMYNLIYCMKRRIGNSNGSAEKYGPKRPNFFFDEKSLFCAPTKKRRRERETEKLHSQWKMKTWSFSVKIRPTWFID